jgi:hypothetical protein
MILLYTVRAPLSRRPCGEPAFGWHLRCAARRAPGAPHRSRRRAPIARSGECRAVPRDSTARGRAPAALRAASSPYAPALMPPAETFPLRAPRAAVNRLFECCTGYDAIEVLGKNRCVLRCALRATRASTRERAWTATLTRRSKLPRASRSRVLAPAQPLPAIPRRLRDGEAPASGQRRDGAHGARRVRGAASCMRARDAPARAP